MPSGSRVHELCEADGVDRLAHLLVGGVGRAKATLSRIVPVKRNGSWGTTPSWRRSEFSVTSRRSWPSMVTLPVGRVVEARDELGDRRLARSGRADERDRLARRGSRC